MGGIEALKQVLNDEVFGNVRDTLVPAILRSPSPCRATCSLSRWQTWMRRPTRWSTGKTVFTALASRMLLGRRLKVTRVALVLLCVGGVLVSDLSGA